MNTKYNYSMNAKDVPGFTFRFTVKTDKQTIDVFTDNPDAVIAETFIVHRLADKNPVITNVVTIKN